MKTKKVLLGVTVAVVIAGLVMKTAKRRRRTAGKRLIVIADEGYETAHDILFPRNRKEFSKLRYGPVLPR